MTSLQYLSEDELIRQGLEALMKTLGPIEATRFLTLPHRPRMESVQRHRRWQASLDQQAFFKQVFGTADEAGNNQ